MMRTQTRLIAFTAAVATAVGALVPVPVAAAPADRPPAARATEAPLRDYVAGTVALGPKAWVHDAPVSARTLSGRALDLPQRLRTSSGGGLFFRAGHLPRRFIVTVTLRPHNNPAGMRGHLRAVVDRRNPTTSVTLGTTIAAALFARGSSVPDASRGALSVLGLPETSRLGFDDRYNRSLVSPRRVASMSDGSLDRLVRRAVNAWSSRRTVALAAPATKNPRVLARALERRRKSLVATTAGALGSTDPVVEVFKTGVDLVTAIITGATAEEEQQDMAQASAAIAGFNANVSEFAGYVAQTIAVIADLESTSAYNAAAAEFEATYQIPVVIDQLTALASSPCPTNGQCTASQLQGYTNALYNFAGTSPLAQVPGGLPAGDTGITPVSGSSILAGADDLVLDLLGSSTGEPLGADASLTNLAWNAAIGQGPAGLGPMNGTATSLLTAPLSAQSSAMVNYWLAQLQAAYVAASNVQNSTLSMPAFESNYNILSAAVSSTQAVKALPDGTALDLSTNNLWTNLGQFMVTGTPNYPELSVSGEYTSGTVAGMTPTNPAGATISDGQVTISAGLNLPGATAPAADLVAAGLTNWNLPAVASASPVQIPCPGLGNTNSQPITYGWSSPQLGWAGSGNTGLLTQMAPADWQNVWWSLGNLPVTIGSQDHLVSGVVSTTPDVWPYGGCAYTGTEIGWSAPVWSYGATGIETCPAAMTSQAVGRCGSPGGKYWQDLGPFLQPPTTYTVLQGAFSDNAFNDQGWPYPSPGGTPQLLVYTTLTPAQVADTQWAGDPQTPPGS